MDVPLKYYFENNHKVCVNFDKYTIDENGVIRNKATREALRYTTDKDGYQSVSVRDASGKQRNIQVGRAIASTFLGPPTTKAHTADHKDKNRANDILENIRWLCKRGQRINQTHLDEYKTAFIVIRDGEEKPNKEWVEYLNSKGENNPYGREYTSVMIQKYAQKKQHGFAYMEYPDLPGEIWKYIEGSKNKRGMWQVSNMNRVKYVTKFAENVLEKDRLRLNKAYPMIKINGKQRSLHVVVFMTFFPDEWANKQPGEIVLHNEDDKLDFRPEMLHLGPQSENMIDAHNNGCYDGTLITRQKCASYIDDVFEKEHESQLDAAKYLMSIGFDKAHSSSIHRALIGEQKTAYKRTWMYIVNQVI